MKFGGQIYEQFDYLFAQHGRVTCNKYFHCQSLNLDE